jgi:LysR family transcriptional regulator, low CO2-responsive transcriptional regulator
MSISKLTMARLAEEPLLVRERGSGTRTTVERLFKDAGLRMRIGSELSSNEAIKQMCAAGFGPAYLSLHTCILELNAGLLTMLPLPKNLVERQWFVVHVATRDLPQVAVAFERFLCDHAQTEILRQFGQQQTKLTSRKSTPKKEAVRSRRVRAT